jgi:hypothetical protein
MFRKGGCVAGLCAVTRLSCVGVEAESWNVTRLNPVPGVLCMLNVPLSRCNIQVNSRELSSVQS